MNLGETKGSSISKLKNGAIVADRHLHDFEEKKMVVKSEIDPL